MQEPKINFNYPLDFECKYVFPTRYYLNVKTGHNIIKREHLDISKPVIIGKNGIVKDDTNENDTNENRIDEENI